MLRKRRLPCSQFALPSFTSSVRSFQHSISHFPFLASILCSLDPLPSSMSSSYRPPSRIHKTLQLHFHTPSFASSTSTVFLTYPRAFNQLSQTFLFANEIDNIHYRLLFSLRVFIFRFTSFSSWYRFRCPLCITNSTRLSPHIRFLVEILAYSVSPSAIDLSPCT